MIFVREGTVEEVHSLLVQLEEFKDPYSPKELEERLNGTFLILIAEKDGVSIGFKCGYERDIGSRKFYSWLGGVVEKARDLGVAKDLLQEMEKWCRAKGFEYLEFKTMNEHQKMLVFSIRHGFSIEEVLQSPKDDRKRIILRKKLN